MLNAFLIRLCFIPSVFAVAFMKLNLFSNLTKLDIEKGIELDKVYILPEFKRMKIGKILLDLEFDIAKKNNKEIFWLSVIDTNLEAIAFYEKIGFRFHSKTQLDYPKFKEELKVCGECMLN